ncbi:3-oxoacyl-[acyl-carrier protein] reductase [Thiohalospira halophila DSM 15071]|uniref:3-oxoacyl-[acyl-carrier protein] reductase n=1 Tax=Thiohalospira halophila DSM 15071 TaxID=1123397 RepID=A0A1I1V0S2_9GAMM|nr:SDR family oxidoreductase [Thiohalospira halophila]SFD76626.1 3-oxoacyl-[acyl-carrier protein] reductase [Thiohalospira halophila DSM 15071]
MDHAEDLTGRTLYITGGGRGIGLATARLALEAGARVAIATATADSATRAAAELGAGSDRLFAAAADVRDYAALAAWLRQAEERIGPPDALVNSAGTVAVGPFAEQAPADYQAVVDINVTGLMHGCHAALPALRERGGTIINISSGAGFHGIPEAAAYSASKFAVNGFTQALHLEEGPRVRVFALCPGRVATDMQEAFSGRRQGIAPEQVARRILALAGPEPDGTPGECEPVG